MPTGRKLSADQLTAARIAYEAGATFRELAAEHGVAMSTMRVMLVAVGVTSRPVGFQPRPAPPPPRPVVEISQDVTGRLRIPLRTAEQRRVRDWLPAELEAIAQALRAGRVTYAPRGRSGLPERGGRVAYSNATFAFFVAMKRLKAA